MFTAAQPRAGATQKNRAREQDSPRPTLRTQVFFEDVRVPAKNLIGEEGQGFTYQMLQFQEERLFAAANLLRTLDRILDETAEYAMNRQIFGKPLLANQVPASCAYVPRPSAYTPTVLLSLTHRHCPACLPCAMCVCPGGTIPPVRVGDRGGGATITDVPRDPLVHPGEPLLDCCVVVPGCRIVLLNGG